MTEGTCELTQEEMVSKNNGSSIIWTYFWWLEKNDVELKCHMPSCQSQFSQELASKEKLVKFTLQLQPVAASLFQLTANKVPKFGMIENTAGPGKNTELVLFPCCLVYPLPDAAVCVHECCLCCYSV